MQTTTVVSADLIASDPIKAAIQLCQKPESEDISFEELKDAEESLKQLNQIESNLLPVESEMFQLINAKKLEVGRKINQLKYPLFSLEPLKWRDGKGRPRLAVFSMSSSNCELVFDPPRDALYGHTGLPPSLTATPLPKEILECYTDQAKLPSIVPEILLFLCSPAFLRIRMNTRFVGLIPNVVKQEIARVRGQFKEIFIVAEAQGWNVETEKFYYLNQSDIQPTALNTKKSYDSYDSYDYDSDPLVVGYDGINYWLIAAFDTTSLEEYIKSEFCVK